jgi:nitric oxide reductase large subunit
MSVLPLQRWVVITRKAILWVGFGWPVATYFLAPAQQGPSHSHWEVIGFMFLATIFVPPSLVLSLVLPTFKWRIIALPPLLIAIYWGESFATESGIDRK